MKRFFPEINYSEHIVASPRLFEYCKQRYPKRKVESSSWVDDYDSFYYFNKSGQVRMVRNKTEIWILGEEWPEIMRRR